MHRRLAVSVPRPHHRAGEARRGRRLDENVHLRGEAFPPRLTAHFDVSLRADVGEERVQRGVPARVFRSQQLRRAELQDETQHLRGVRRVRDRGVQRIRRARRVLLVLLRRPRVAGFVFELRANVLAPVDVLENLPPARGEERQHDVARHAPLVAGLPLDLSDRPGSLGVGRLRAPPQRAHEIFRLEVEPVRATAVDSGGKRLLRLPVLLLILLLRRHEADARGARGERARALEDRPRARPVAAAERGSELVQLRLVLSRPREAAAFVPRERGVGGPQDGYVPEEARDAAVRHALGERAGDAVGVRQARLDGVSDARAEGVDGEIARQGARGARVRREILQGVLEPGDPLQRVPAVGEVLVVDFEGEVLDQRLDERILGEAGRALEVDVHPDQCPELGELVLLDRDLTNHSNASSSERDARVRGARRVDERGGARHRPKRRPARARASASARGEEGSDDRGRRRGGNGSRELFL